MEKGNTRSSSAKTNSSADLKNKQDGNKYTRYARYKPDSISPRPDARFKPNPQKSRESFDKRPRARSGAICERYRNEVAIGISTNGGSKQGSKKVNLNHLLNFTLTPSDGSSREYGSRRPNWGYKAKMPKYNKEQFLQANCQFVVHEVGDYSQHSKNPDLLVHWSSIQEVRIPTYEGLSCPICLYAPVAAKITRCGHIYCWPCILHYLALTDKSWHKCPICFEAVHSDDLKSVTPLMKIPFVAGSTIKMCLMKRGKGCMFPVPANHDNYESVVKMHDAESVTKYQKLLLATKNEIRDIILREREELEAQFLIEENQPESCFIKAALELLHEREQLLNLGNCDIFETKEKCDSSNSMYISHGRADISTEAFDGAISNLDSFHENVYISSGTTHDSKLPIGLLDDGVSAESNKGKGTFYFYQDEDGQYIYLHGLNVRMLIKEFGSLENSPPVIEGKILELEKISMTEILRKRLRYLQHIPLTCEFQVAELNFDHLISEQTIHEFSGEVTKRHKLRNHKAQEEKKRERYIEVEENKKMGRYPSATYNINSSVQFPVCHSESHPREMAEQSISENYELQYPSFGMSNLSLKENSDSCSPPTASFAQMLRDGQVSFSHELPPKTAKTPLDKKADTKNCEDFDEESLAVPEYRLSFSNVIQAALETAMNEQNDGNAIISKKKKKRKSRVLFTTSMCRNK